MLQPKYRANLLAFSTVTVSSDRTLPHEHATVDDERPPVPSGLTTGT